MAENMQPMPEQLHSTPTQASDEFYARFVGMMGVSAVTAGAKLGTIAGLPGGFIGVALGAIIGAITGGVFGAIASYRDTHDRFNSHR